MRSRRYFRFPGLKTEKLCVVTKCRLDEETLEFCYDIAVCSVENPLAPIKKMIPSTKKEDIAKWQPRGLLRQAPKTAEEVRIEKEMEMWTFQLKRSAASDARTEARNKIKDAEIARLKRRGGRKKAERKTLSAEEVAAARKRRVESEKAIRDEEERKKKEQEQVRKEKKNEARLPPPQKFFNPISLSRRTSPFSQRQPRLARASGQSRRRRRAGALAGPPRRRARSMPRRPRGCRRRRSRPKRSSMRGRAPWLQGRHGSASSSST